MAPAELVLLQMSLQPQLELELPQGHSQPLGQPLVGLASLLHLLVLIIDWHFYSH